MAASADIYEFGEFRLDADAGILFRGAQPTLLGQRALPLLRLLLDRAGAPASKDALVEAAWPGLAIADSSLTVQIAALRRVLGEGASGESWIETLPRHGYRYVGPVITTRNALAEIIPQPMPPLALPEKPSVAVLPFSNLSGDPEQGYFADGVVDDIITGLSRIKWLFVIARNSSFTYRGRAVDVKQVGRELGVRYVVEGSVRKMADRVRIAAHLIDTTTGAHFWGERYDRKFEDIFAVQDEIALSVVGAIEPSLRHAEVERVKRKRPRSLDAYDFVLRAQPDVYSGMPEPSARALALLERAIELDPLMRRRTLLPPCVITIASCARGCTRKTEWPRSIMLTWRSRTARMMPSR
jgi:TolB-like protein